MFQIDLQHGASWLTNSRGTASPPTRILSFGLPAQPASSRSRQVDGVPCIAVISRPSISRRNRLPSAVVSLVAITTVAPIAKGRNSSSPAMSNESVVTESNTSSAVNPGSRPMD